MLLFAIVAAGATLILVSGLQVKDEVSKQQQIEQAGESMQRLDSELDTLSLTAATNVSNVGFPDDGSIRFVDGSSATVVKFHLNDPATAACTAKVVPRGLNYSIHGVGFVYEAGGIWRVPAEGDPVMVSPPDFSYNNQTEGNGTVSFAPPRLIKAGNFDTDSMRVSNDYLASNRSSNAKTEELLTPSADCSPRERLTVTVETRFYESWKAHLDRETPEDVPVTVSGSGDRRTVTVEFAPEDLRDFDSDDDGVVDSDDNCPAYYNSPQRNSDLTDDDGVSDTASDEEAWSSHSSGDGDGKHPRGDVCDSDDDGDGVSDDRNADAGSSPHDGYVTDSYFRQSRMADPFHGGSRDNCPKTDNPDQKNGDGDSLGNACDPDKDGDGLLNRREVCAKDYNPKAPSIYPYARDLPEPPADWPTNNVPKNDTDGGSGVVDAYERSDDDVPNACDPDDDGDGYPDYGYYYNQSQDGDVADGDYDEDGSDYGYAGDLHRDPASTHERNVGDPAEDNCPREPNAGQANFDEHSNNLRDDDPGSNVNERDDRGDACDRDTDDDGIRDENEWEAHGDDPCLYDTNVPSGSDASDRHTGTHEPPPHNHLQKVHTHTEKRCTGNPGTPVGDCSPENTTTYETDHKHWTDAPGEPHGDAGGDDPDKVWERCEQGDAIYNNTAKPSRRGSALFEDQSFDREPMCDPTNTPDWSTSDTVVDVYLDDEGCHPTEPPAVYEQRSPPSPDTRVVEFDISIVRIDD